ncbi:MAG: SBBP repeat-containing protein [Flavobacteriales bacterium]|nr:SBBP repeat-containing protein [Flavobacteriales bacterium]
MSPTSTRLTSFAAALLFMIGAQAKPINGPGGHEPAINTAGLTVAPSGFEENKGQVRTTTGAPAPFVRYRLTQGNTSIFLLGNGIAYQFNRSHYSEGYAALEKDAHLDPAKQQELDALRKEVRLETYRMDMLLEGANPNARITTEGRSADYTQYYNHDALDVYTYTRITYREVYPGINWVVYTTAKGLKYDFVLQPGADPAHIQLRFTDHEELFVDAQGQLIHGNRMGRFTEARPVSFQNGKEVSTRFVLDGDRLSFALGAYDPNQPLIIDPARIWGTYYGGTSTEYGESCSVDGSGNVYLAGVTYSSDAIASGGHQDTYGGGNYDAFLVKFNASGVRQWGTYYGGTGIDFGYSCAVDASGNVYLAGETRSTTAIASGGQQDTIGGGDDAFLVKFNASGVRQWGTYYGGTNGESGRSCAVDASGNVYLSGTTQSSTAIASGGHQNTYGGGQNDAFLVKFNASGVRQWGTYYGGPVSEEGRACAVDGSDNVYLAGWTNSTTAIASGGQQDTIVGSSYPDAFLVKFNASGVRLWGTYYGGTEYDYGRSCAVDASGNVFLAGTTNSTTAIASGGHQDTYGGGNYDAFLVKFNPNGVRQWGTYYGGTEYDYGRSCAVDASGNVFLAGFTNSTTAIASGGHQDTYGGGNYDAFLVNFNASGVRQWGTYCGGTEYDYGRSCAVDASGNVYLTGATNSTTAIASAGHQNTYGGGVYDAFLVKFEAGPAIGILSLEDPDPSLSIFPNPSNGAFTLSGAQPMEPFTITDLTGRLIHTGRSNANGTAAVQLPNATKGLYLIQLGTGAHRLCRKLIVSH